MTDKNPNWILSALALYEKPLLRYGARLLGSSEGARDIVQETFLELCKVKRASVESHLAPWLFRVCRNRALDVRRKDKRMQPLSEAQDLKIESPDDSPHAIMEKSQDAENLLGMVKKLPESQQEIVFLRFQSGLSYKEIAEVTGRTVSNVGVLIHTAVKTIRDNMMRSGDEPNALEGAL
ncbi:MAG: sigma-70 family RNA polymerase sigma factor [Kofleriaceae bacterium]|nr:sigma-70 family RNA polymerase sigma factor [Kofleriaceae bacterium]